VYDAGEREQRHGTECVRGVRTDGEREVIEPRDHEKCGTERRESEIELAPRDVVTLNDVHVDAKVLPGLREFDFLARRLVVENVRLVEAREVGLV
jgi:hypothetical protein